MLRGVSSFFRFLSEAQVPAVLLYYEQLGSKAWEIQQLLLSPQLAAVIGYTPLELKEVIERGPYFE